MIYTLERTQFLSCSLEETWRFFTNPHNLATITPDSLDFTVLNTFDEEEIYEGMRINYYVRPLLGIRLAWQTKILEVHPQRSFVDLQEKGPYKLWRHQHEFFEEGAGVRMKDTVQYELPFGILGTLAHRIVVRKKLREIFDFRYQTLEKILNDADID
ncbi:SRPBCC family protein [Sphingobacterium griseoflavum]|uniref:SRPBCC domain-containing protein n=1 Tax=Sphingobacterium griseoflavum TaxID=1474952 RepID=A0ABQ3HT50_9SPHI|nr:SRPBCC family protein [Sphingobacterium griseoflavum]GHE23347.1 SRPBCC domain-containing protein [Sphingobacterium griseoflavum]